MSAPNGCPPRRSPVKSWPVTAAPSDATANAVRHGLTARRPILGDEDPTEFAAHVAALRTALSPSGALEEMFVERIGLASWRLRRLISVEAEVFDRNRERLSSANEERIGRGLGEAFMLGITNGGVWAALSRYEAAIARQLRADLHELQRLQAARAGVPVSPPAVVDVLVEVASGLSGPQT
jgi:hypothetical protein